MVKRVAAETLIELAAATVRDELAPQLGPDGRYAAAMVVSALEIARREILADGDAALWKLLDSLYEEGEGTARQLALDIRTGTVSEAKRPGLGRELLAVLEAELAIRNPRFLASRKT